MKTLLSVPLDDAAIADTASRLELRKPNAAAMEAVAKAVAASAGVSLEVVCSMATGVGKTYLAAGLLDYFVAQGVRNFLIVTPGSTVLRKTIDNFTPGHPKSVLDGMTAVPTVITADNFNTGAVASALTDDDQVKLFVFNIQGLTAPRRGSKRTHEFTEWLGGDLYKHLATLEDLVVLADEHHTYSEDAEVFSKTVRSLEPVVLVGLTATPAESDLNKVVFDYPLARAIADGYVKTPVLVGRTDGSTDRELQLRDGLALLAAKQELADAWAEGQGRERVNAVMFVVAETIADADEVARLLRKPGLFDTDFDERVLIVHSEAGEDALLRLAQVEEPDSKVRVIVSVSMLKEGWDVKNIFVICSMRPSVSDTLTEQTLGRGLRLPWGAYTGHEFLDTVEVLSHERYADILKKADVLLDGLVARRLETLTAPAAPQPPARTVEPAAGAAPAGSSGVAQPAPPAGRPADIPAPPHHVAAADISTAASVSSPVTPEPAPGLGADVIDGTDTAEPTLDGGAWFVDAADDTPAPAVTTLEDRMGQAREAAALKPRDLPRRQNFAIPRVRRQVTERKPLALSSIPDSDFRLLGQQMAGTDAAKLSRMEFRVVDDPSSPSGLKLVPTEVESVVAAASLVELPLGDVLPVLKRGLLAVKVVSSANPADGSAARRLAEAFIAGAGGTDKVAPYTNQAITAMSRFLTAKHRAAPEQFENVMDTAAELPTVRTVLRKQEANRFGAFDRAAAYTGWSDKAAYPEAWFDSKPERDFANLLDSLASTTVTKWARLHRGDLVIEWESGRYNPDFIFAVDDVNYLVEVKGQDRLTDPTTLAKKQAAADWARFVSDEGSAGQWRYLFVPQSEVSTPIGALIARLTAE